MSEIKCQHVPFAAFLRERGIPFINPRPDEPSGIAEGHPDFTLTVANHSLMIEFKWKDGKLSKKQQDRIADLRRAGNTVFVIYDLERAQSITAAWRASLGEVIDATPEAERQRDRAAAGLRRFGNGVFERAGDGWKQVRVATAKDAGMQTLTP